MAVVIGVHLGVCEGEGAAHAQLDADGGLSGGISRCFFYVFADDGELFALSVDGGDFAVVE